MSVTESGKFAALRRFLEKNRAASALYIWLKAERGWRELRRIRKIGDNSLVAVQVTWEHGEVRNRWTVWFPYRKIAAVAAKY